MATLKILIVDNDIISRLGTIEVLKDFKIFHSYMNENFDYNLIECASGNDAVEIAEQEKPEIILLWNSSNDTQEKNILFDLKKKAPEALVVMIFEHESLEDAVKITSGTVIDFIYKPVSSEKLKFVIDNVTKQFCILNIQKKLQSEEIHSQFGFISLLSHELKSPLNAIEGYLHLMQECNSQGDQQGFKKMIDRSLQRTSAMRSLISDLLDLSKIHLSKRLDKVQDVDLVQIVYKAIENVQSEVTKKHVNILFHLSNKLIFRADPLDIEILFNNLISNAVKYNKKNGQVDIIIRSSKNIVKIEVKDTGIGLSDKDISSLFNDFVRIKNEHTKHIPGTGLGLSIVKRIVELYHGEINVSGKPGVGSAFKLMLKSEP